MPATVVGSFPNLSCACPSGMHLTSGANACACDNASFSYNYTTQQCGCPAGTMQVNGTGACVPIVQCNGGTVTAANTCSCTAPKQYYMGSCVQPISCTGGTLVNPFSCSCPSGQTYVASTGSCQSNNVCIGGTNNSAGQCICPSGQILVNNIDTNPTYGTCMTQATCAPGQTYNRVMNVCMPNTNNPVPQCVVSASTGGMPPFTVQYPDGHWESNWMGNFVSYTNPNDQVRVHLTGHGNTQYDLTVFFCYPITWAAFNAQLGH